MHKLTVNCECGERFEVELHNTKIYKNYFNCIKCNKSYYVKYIGNGQYEINEI